MTQLQEYAHRYPHVRMRREEGVLELTLHSDGGTLQWERGVHDELGFAFRDVAADWGNRVIIITGAGDRFIAEFHVDPPGAARRHADPPEWDHVYWEGKQLLTGLLDIEVPVIAAVNGPVNVHAELAVLADIVLAADTTTFQDAAHFPNGRVPGDGVQVVWPWLLGPNRGRYFLLTGEVLAAAEAQRLGVVAEVLPSGQLLDRAWSLARQLAEAPDLALRYARVVLTQPIRSAMLNDLSHGLALQGLAFNDRRPGDG